MSLEDAIAELDKQAGEEVEVEEVETEEVETPEPDKVEEPAKEEPVEKIELKAPEINPTPQDWYKLREETKKRETVEAELAALKAPKIPSREEDFEGNVESRLGVTAQDIADLKAWKQGQEIEKKQNADREAAFAELNGYEQEAAAAFPDYSDAAKHAKSMIAASIKLLEPAISPQELAQRTIYKYAEYAAQALNDKKHPGQAIYELANQWGYKKAAAVEVAQDNKRPTITKLGEAKKKSSGMHNNGGNGKAFVGNEELLAMSNADRMKLTESDWARLEAEG